VTTLLSGGGQPTSDAGTDTPDAGNEREPADRPPAKVPRRGAGRTVVLKILRRLLAAVLTVWAAVTLAFGALWLAPGSTVDALIGEGPDTPLIRAQIIAEWGLDRPIVVQYLDYLARLLSGDLGRSYVKQQPVTLVLSDQIRPTLELASSATVLAVLFAVGLGILGAGRPRLRTLLSGVQLALVSIPTFWLGILLLVVFSFHTGWFPVAGANGLRSLVLPAITLALPIGSVIGQVLGDGLERALERPFALTARTRGISRWRLLNRHALRHALLPVVTITGWVVGGLLGGTVIVEQVFGRPGLGQVALQAVTTTDMPVVLAVVLASTAVYVLVSSIVDLLYLVIDPRLRDAV
jgi:peptide/nickel transport system permease protein